MSEDRYARVKEVFAAARARPQEKRDAFLDEACGLDAELRQEVRSLLAYDAESTGLRTWGSAGTFAAVERIAPGTVLAGRYRVTGRLGRGGMGEIYRAEDALLGVPVALKLLPAELAEEVERLSLLLNEVRLARAVTHPNVCRIHDVGEQDGLHFISMELIAGEDLEARLQRVGRLTREEALGVARGLCAGLDAAHAQGILHRDLKPANLLIDESGELHIADFGLSLDIGDGPARAWPQAGTPAYMAPEQHAGGEVSVRTDLYAVGLVLSEVFTGRRAFSASSRAELARLHREAAPANPSEIVADLDPAIEKVILRCLEKDPRRRPSSAQAVASALPGRLDLTEGTQLRTLVMSDIVDRTRLVERLGDSRAAELFERHDLFFGDLVREHGGREVDVPPTQERSGRLLLFERPIHAVLFAHAYHGALAELSTATRSPWEEKGGGALEACLAVHLGEVVLRHAPDAGLLRVEGLAPRLVVRLVALAGARQTLLTRGAFDVARRGAVDEAERAGRLSWLAHGRYLFEGIEEAVEIFEVGEPGWAPLETPEGSEEARRVYDEDVLTGWRPAAGRTLPGRPHWALDQKLGEGGFGEVWLAVHRKMRERRVLKFCYEASRLRSLQREITLFRLLKEELGDRDDIGRILDWNFEEPPYFIESEYATNFEEWAAARGGTGEVPLAERLEIVAQVAEALSAAHSVGVLHKDVKPSNVLMWCDAEGRYRARLADFGIGAVTEHERLAEAGITVLGMTETTPDGSSSDTGGTRLYMAPELIEGRAATVQADVYALGVMLYQVVVGDLKRALAPGWRRDVEDELLREDLATAVDGDPELRLSSAADLGRRLRTLDERRAEHARRRAAREADARLRQTLEQLRRRRRLAIAVAAVLAVFAVTVGILAIRIQREAQRAKDQAEKARELARSMAAAKLLVDREPTVGNLVALEVRRPEATQTAVANLHTALTVPVELAVLRHDDLLRSVSWSHDERRVLTVSRDRTARVWTEDGDEVSRLNAPQDDLRKAMFNPDSTRVLTTSYNGKCRIWNADTGEEVFRLGDPMDHVWDASWSHDGQRTVTGLEDKTARIWNADTGEERLRLGHEEPVYYASFSGDGRRVVAVSGAIVHVWDSETGAEIARMGGHTDWIRSASWSGDGSRILTASRDGTARIWNVAAGAEIVRMEGHTGWIRSASWSGDGSRILTASNDKTTRIWDAETGAELVRLDGHESGVAHSSWSRDGRAVATSGVPMRIWNAAAGTEITRIHHDDAGIRAFFSEDGRRLLTASLDKTARIWNIEIGTEIARMEGQVSSWNGRHVVTGSEDGTVRIWDVETGDMTSELRGHTDFVGSVSMSGDGRRVLSASNDRTTRIWDMETGELLAQLGGHPGRVWRAFWNGDGHRVVTSSNDHMARIWDAETGTEIARLRGHDMDLMTADWSGDDRRILTASLDETARIWDAETGAEVAVLSGHAGGLYDASWSRDGRRVLTASADRTARVWDAATGAEILRFSGHQHEVLSARWSPDDRRVATASRDQTARVWDAETGVETARLRGHTRVIRSAWWSGDGRRVLTRSLDRTVRVWDAETGTEIVRMAGHEGSVLSASWSGDGRRVLTSSDDGTTRIWVVPDEQVDYLRGRIRARTQLCLPVDFRQETLLESPTEAESHAAACERCVLVFFRRLGAAPKSDWATYVAAWRVYEACLGRDG